MNTVIEGRLARIVDRNGVVHAELAWDGDRLVRLAVAGATVDGSIIGDPLVGDAHRIAAIDTRGLPADAGLAAASATTMSALDWANPTEIPIVAHPAKIPAGAGSAILNVVAHLAKRPLRYAGPYPTPALFTTLLRSFRTTATEAEFTRDLVARSARLARDPIAIDFVPAPHERVAIAGGYVERRDGIERISLGGIAYERSATGIARIVDVEGESHAEIWFADQVFAHVASVSAEGDLVDGPHPIPPYRSGVTGREFPVQLRTALGELVAELVAAPLASDARTLVATSPLVWADLGARAAAKSTDGFAVHAVLWDRLAPRGLARVAEALAEALAPVVAAAIVSRVSSPHQP